MIGPLPPRPTGASPSARFFQWVWDTLATGQVTTRQSHRAKVSRTTRGVIVEAIGGDGSGSARVRKLILKDAAAADYLVCRPWNAEYWQARRELRVELGEVPTNAEIAARMAELLDEDFDEADLDEYLAREVIVAKPPELRADDFDGFTIDIEVESWDGASLTSETRSLSYEYPSATLRVATDDEDNDETEIIIPRYLPEESIIYAISTGQTEMTVSERSVTLVDMNHASRYWQRISE